MYLIFQLVFPVLSLSSSLFYLSTHFFCIRLYVHQPTQMCDLSFFFVLLVIFF
ncbi:hypothetical protein Lalb_Chr21g0314541 [Lupinus albus]|uniref:Uncharacterized protein n=1 Tax=Lupinus albus TaxID=3870 RepID=A0A6A4NRG5_LUPAL|nr:hypothetical protein Lalb_Chr21g0314541 [Lupinus albus]